MRFTTYLTTLALSALPPILSSAMETGPIDPAWLQQTLRQEHPRLIWQPGDEALIRRKVATDETARIFHEFILQQADGMLEAAPLERIVTGRRLLGVSRQALKRSTHLGYAWRVTGDPRYLDALDRLLRQVCQFSDWNPSHFLDTAEMSLAVAVALDWAHGSLPGPTVGLARQALMGKGLQASLAEDRIQAFKADNNWNQVCNAGMVAAALVLLEDDPQLAATIVSRMRDHLPAVLETYAPDGVYVEGASYWGYGTMFHVVLLSMLETALGGDFGLAAWPGFMESADFIHQMTAPSGLFFNFSDCAPSAPFMEALPWFALKTGQRRHLMEAAIRDLPMRRLEPSGQAQRMAPFSFLWYLRFEPAPEQPLALGWVGQGDNPVGVLRSAFDDPAAFYLAFKGGRATLNHPNMDAGSFILEMHGIRWALDLEMGDYNRIEQHFKETGGSLWERSQDSRRWTLLNKNNFGHSTLTIDGELHLVDGQAEIVAFDPVARTGTIDLTGPLANKVDSATRTFAARNHRTVQITDTLHLKDAASTVRWQMMTDAEVETFDGGAILWADGKALRLAILEPEGLNVSVTSLFPPPAQIDEWLGGLKRIDINVPSYRIRDGQLVIRVRLTAISPDELRTVYPFGRSQQARPAGWDDITDPVVIRSMLDRAFDWQMNHLCFRQGGAGWINGTFYTGVAALYRATGDPKYRQAILDIGEASGWLLRPTRQRGDIHHADNHCIGQAWLELYLDDPQPQPAWIAGVQDRLERIMADPLPGREDMWWCDALYMSPPNYALLAKITGDTRYLAFVDRQWWDVTDFLYDPAFKLFYRDASYFGVHEPNGQPVFWSRGNGWVVGGLVRMLQHLPPDWPSRSQYVVLLQDMLAAVAAIQGADGLWSSSLLYPEKFDLERETSGSAFFLYAMAWGVNEGVLDRATFAPVIEQAWRGLAPLVNASGTIDFIQQVGANPKPNNGEYFNKDFGYGAYLLAGTEMIRYFESR